MNGKEHALGEYRVGKLIAEGGFGFVYNGEAPDGKPVAIKYERTYDRITRPHLKHEADVFRLLQGNPCVPTVYAYDRDERWNIMVVDLLGKSLQKLFDKCGKQFTLKTTLMLGIQTIECVEYMHNKGIIHRDIKPDNFLIGRGSTENAVHIIDFGLARRYKRPDTGEHFPYFEGHNFFGTTRYASLNAQLGRSQSRRDDLESLAYSLIQFLRGRLPWQSLRGGTDKHREERIKEKKRTWTPQRLCEDLPKEFETFLTYVKNLTYEEEPGYEYLKSLLRNLFDREGFALDFDYDWKSLSEDGQSEEEPSELANSASDRAPSQSPSTQAISATAVEAEPLNGTSEQKDETAGPEVAASASEVAVDESAQSIPPPESAIPDEADEGANQPEPEVLSVKEGSFILLKVLARPTLEFADPLWDAPGEGEEPDNSYCHQPSLSKPEWTFKWRPAIVTDFSYGTGRCKLGVMPLMVRPNGLADIPERRHKSFIRIATGKSDGVAAGDVGGASGEVTPTPTWPLEGTYSFLQFDEYSMYVWTEDVREVKALWSLDAEQLARLKGTREAEGVAPSVYDLKRYDDDDEETLLVKKSLCKTRVVGGNPVFGDIASFDESALKNADVDLTGAQGFLPETFKIEVRRERENGDVTAESGDTTRDLRENLSFYTGPVPGNRRKSCTLAIEPEHTLDAPTLEVDASPEK